VGTPQVLIVEDEQSASRLLSALCGEVGLSAQITRSGKEAVGLVQMASGGPTPFACVVLDLVLAEGDGFSVAQRLRADHPEIPLIVISGIYKSLPPEFQAKVRPDLFFPKPFEPAHLRDGLRRLCLLTAAPPSEGRIDGPQGKPVSLLLVELLRAKASGVLTVSSDGSVRKLHLQAGLVRFAQGNVKSEMAGAAQIASGVIKQASFDRAVALARQQRIALHEALATARVFTPEQLKAALKQQTVDVAVGAIAAAAGTHVFEAQPVELLNGLPDTRTSPVQLISEEAQRSRDVARARTWLSQQQGEKVSRSPELERELFALKATWPGEGVTPLAASGRTLGEVLTRMKEAELPLLHALCAAGLITLSRNVPSSVPHPSAPRSAAEEDRGKVFSAKEHEARRLLFAERDRLKDKGHYELLGVDPKAGPDEIRAAYFKAARKFHSDGFSGMELGSARRVAEELFQRVNEANQTLGSAKERAEYDVFLDRKAKGLSTDVAAILKAESVFQKGELFFKAGKFDDAEPLFREAIALNHAEAEFHAYLGISLLRGKKRLAAAQESIDQALHLDPRLLSAQVFLAALKSDQGDDVAARTLLRKVLEQDPGNALAKAEGARIKAKTAEPEKKAGFFASLFKK
jgi:CheY-like chemotaxis protein